MFNLIAGNSFQFSKHFQNLLRYYMKKPYELAYQIAHQDRLTENEFTRLEHEADLQDYVYLKTVLPKSAPLLKTLKKWFKTNPNHQFQINI